LSWIRNLLLVVALLLAACETPTRVFTYGARGTEIQAERLVAGVYGLPADPLPYGGPDIDRPLQRMTARWPALKALLDDGTAGLTADGEVAVRDYAGREQAAARQVKALVKAENRDRDELYRGMTAAIGHGGNTLPQMLGYTEDTFGGEWIRLAPAGWWVQDHQGRWSRKFSHEASQKPAANPLAEPAR
jgi:hypothetical protein